MPCDAFALLCRALPCLALALPCYAELIYAFALLSVALPCYALAVPCHAKRIFAMPLLCPARVSFPRFASETAIFRRSFLASPNLSVRRSLVKTKRLNRY
jgi:hypothetical protein